MKHFEPWTAARTKVLPPHPFPNGVPEDVDPDAAARAVDQYEKAVAEADWIVWGSNMAWPATCVNLDGSTTEMSGSRIVAILPFIRGMPKGSPSNEALAKRIASCMNSMEGIRDLDNRSNK